MSSSFFNRKSRFSTEIQYFQQKTGTASWQLPSTPKYDARQPMMLVIWKKTFTELMQLIFQQKINVFNRNPDFSTENRCDQITSSQCSEMGSKAIYDVGNPKNNFLKNAAAHFTTENQRFQQKFRLFNRKSIISDNILSVLRNGSQGNLWCL